MTLGTNQARRLTRRSADRIFGGVAGGLADYFGVDAIWIRLGFVLSAFLGGAGIIAYIVLWLIMPEEPADGPTSLERHAERVARSLRGTPMWIGVALVIIGGMLIVAQITDWSAGVFWGIALIVLGLALFRREEAGPEAEAAPPLAPPPPPSDTTAPGLPTSPPIPIERAYRTVRPRRERSGLGWLTLGSLMVVLGVASLLDVGEVVNITLVQYLALALAILGIGMSLGTFWGRARWLILPGTLLIPFVLAASLIEVPFAGGSGDRYFHPLTGAAIDPEYHLVVGYLVVDLSDVALGPGTTAMRATAVAGQIVVSVPKNARVEVRARVGAGEVQLFGREHGGIKVDVRRTIEPTVVPNARVAPTTPPVLKLDLETSFGRVEVTTRDLVEGQE